MSEKPNFYQLQRYSDLWESIIETSQTYGETLRKMKTAYDNYFNALLDQQRDNQDLGVDPKELSYLVLCDPKRESTSIVGKLEEKNMVSEKQKEIKELKNQIAMSLEKNERLRNIVNDRQAEESEQDELLETTENVSQKNQVEVETLQTKVEIKFNDLNALKNYRKQLFVPVAVYRRLEDCVRETEVDIQKLCKQNEYLEGNLDELEDDLDKILVQSGVKTRDGGKAWKKVETVKVNDLNKF